MLFFLIFTFIITAIIYLPINAAVSYYNLRKAKSDVVFASLVRSRRVNMTASAAMIILSVLFYSALAVTFDGSCTEHRGPSAEACGAGMMLVFAPTVLIGLFFLFLLIGLWFFGRKAPGIEPPSILN